MENLLCGCSECSLLLLKSVETVFKKLFFTAARAELLSMKQTDLYFPVIDVG